MENVHMLNLSMLNYIYKYNYDIKIGIWKYRKKYIKTLTTHFMFILCFIPHRKGGLGPRI